MHIQHMHEANVCRRTNALNTTPRNAPTKTQQRRAREGRRKNWDPNCVRDKCDGKMQTISGWTAHIYMRDCSKEFLAKSNSHRSNAFAQKIARLCILVMQVMPAGTKLAGSSRLGLMWLMWIQFFSDTGPRIDEKSGSSSRDVKVAGPFKNEEKIREKIALSICAWIFRKFYLCIMYCITFSKKYKYKYKFGSSAVFQILQIIRNFGNELCVFIFLILRSITTPCIFLLMYDSDRCLWLWSCYFVNCWAHTIASNIFRDDFNIFCSGKIFLDLFFSILSHQRLHVSIKAHIN